MNNPSFFLVSTPANIVCIEPADKLRVKTAYIPMLSLSKHKQCTLPTYLCLCVVILALCGAMQPIIAQNSHKIPTKPRVSLRVVNEHDALALPWLEAPPKYCVRW